MCKWFLLYWWVKTEYVLTSGETRIHINSPPTYGFLWEFTVRYITHTHTHTHTHTNHIKYKKNTTISTILLQKWREIQSYTTCTVDMVANTCIVSPSADVFKNILAMSQQ
jgi:hypothetical protein